VNKTEDRVVWVAKDDAMKDQTINGIHHITAIAGSTQKNVRFYTEILGLRLVKRTINFDSPDTWHLYYGDETGSPASVITFFPFRGVTRGKTGNRSLSNTLYSVGDSSLEFWMSRLKTYQVEYRGPFARFDEKYITFEDFDGLQIELVANSMDKRTGWRTPGIPAKHSIKGFFSAVLSYGSAEKTLDFLINQLEHQVLEQTPERIRLFSGDNKPGNYIDLLSRPSVPGHTPGSGQVHHLAFQVPDEQKQEAFKQKLEQNGVFTSRVMDRQYFKSIYFREPGGVLFELATSGPGFLKDESLENLGTALKLPPWLETDRQSIEANLDAF